MGILSLNQGRQASSLAKTCRIVRRLFDQERSSIGKISKLDMDNIPAKFVDLMKTICIYFELYISRVDA